VLPNLPIPFGTWHLHLQSETTQTATMTTSPVRIRRRRNGLAMGEPLATSASIEGRNVRLNERSGTNVAAPDTIAKPIRGVVFLTGNDWHRAGLPRGRAMIQQQLGDRACNQD
jgi:hypothetical protein